jgi:predicted nucleic acid-binding protein
MYCDPIFLENTDRMIHEIVALARKYHLSSYDASYLHLAMRKGIPLAVTLADSSLSRIDPR